MQEETVQQRSDLLDVKGAAEYLGVAEAFIRRLALEKRVAYYKLGKYVRFKAADLDAFIEGGRVEVVPECELAGQIRNTQLFQGPSTRSRTRATKVS